MTLREYIKKQREECLKHEVNSEEYKEHWELLNYLCEVSRLREENKKLLELVIGNYNEQFKNIEK